MMFFYGGFDDAERRIIILVPDGYADTLEDVLAHRFRYFTSRVAAAESAHTQEGTISGLSSRSDSIDL